MKPEFSNVDIDNNNNLFIIKADPVSKQDDFSAKHASPPRGPIDELNNGSTTCRSNDAS